MTNEEIAEKLLWPAWRGMSDAYKMKYARTIWTQFEDNLRSAAYTSSLPKFFEALARKLSVDIRAKDAGSVAAVLTCGEDRQILKSLRDETTCLVLMVRLKNEERKEKFKKERELDEDLRVRDDNDGAEFDLA
jgi:hypothetical protein